MVTKELDESYAYRYAQAKYGKDVLKNQAEIVDLIDQAGCRGASMARNVLTCAAQNGYEVAKIDRVLATSVSRLNRRLRKLGWVVERRAVYRLRRIK